MFVAVRFPNSPEVSLWEACCRQMPSQPKVPHKPVSGQCDRGMLLGPSGPVQNRLLDDLFTTPISQKGQAIPTAPTPELSRASLATSPPTEAIPSLEASCAAAQTHARPPHTNASPPEPQPSSAQHSKTASPLHGPRGHPRSAAKT